MDKFKNKYRITSARAQWWDYSGSGIYFITICTKNKVNYFGKIKNGVFQPNLIGEIVKTEWLKTLELRSNMNLELGEFVIMPNHLHGILIIGQNEFNSGSGRDTMHRVSMENSEFKNQFGSQTKNLASIIRGYKSAITTYARKNGIEFNWQPGFHEHIVRSEEDLNRITEYIINNPVKWEDDQFYQS